MHVYFFYNKMKTHGHTCSTEGDEDTVLNCALEGATIEGAELDGATLDGAALDGAAPQGAALDGAALEGANENDGMAWCALDAFMALCALDVDGMEEKADNETGGSGWPKPWP